jgi:hypothetical protein
LREIADQESLRRQQDALAESLHNTASVELEAGPVSLGAKVSISTKGLLAIGGMVTGILLSSAVIVLVATRKPS